MIGELILPCFVLLMQNGVPTRLTVSHPIINSQLPRFNSKFASPCCRGIDALVQDWSGENNWVCPPVGLVVDAVRVLTACSGRGTLITPEWPSAYFWPLLRDGPSWFKSFVREVLELPAIKDLILEGPGQRQIYRSHPSVFTVAQNSESWLCVWILGGFLVLSWIVFLA